MPSDPIERWEWEGGAPLADSADRDVLDPPREGHEDTAEQAAGERSQRADDAPPDSA